jgi:hypothetical protein
MNSYNYSYNVLINRLEAFAAGHLLIKRFTHGQIDLADMDQNEQYPFMHVVPNNIKPVEGGMQFDFQILFADIPRDKETKAEYQREVISDCVRLAQDLIAEVKNGLILFGSACSSKFRGTGVRAIFPLCGQLVVHHRAALAMHTASRLKQTA